MAPGVHSRLPPPASLLPFRMSDSRDRRRHPGRARTFARRCAWTLSDWTYRSGWTATLASRLGLQGTVRIRHHHLALPRRAGAPPLRVVFASDFHAGPLTHPAVIDGACRAIARARPDLLLLGGDFVYRRARDVDVLAERLSAIEAPLGRFAVLGNHDYLGEDTHIVRRLEAAGVELLTNRHARLAAPHDDVVVVGLDDSLVGEPDAARALDGADGTRLVLMHTPDGLLDLGDAPFHLACCGHTHGGQVALPFGIPLVLPAGRLVRRFSRGLYTLPDRGDARLLVSRGIGCSGVPVRVFAWPEVHVLELSGGATDAVR